MFSTCEQLAQNLSALEDGEVNGVRRAEAAFHLSWCSQCRAYVAQFREVRRQLAAQKPTDDDADVSRAMSVFDAWADDDMNKDSASDGDDETGSTT